MKKKNIFVLTVLLFLASCAGQDMIVSKVLSPEQPVISQGTKTPVPTVTMGYKETAVSAQNTSVSAQTTAAAAIAVNAEITSVYEGMLLEQNKLDADADQREFIRQSWTATAALTSVPLTATQQVFINTQTSAQSTLKAGLLTATAVYPTQIVAVQRAEDYRKFGTTKQILSIIATFSLVLFVGALIVFLLRFPIPDNGTEAHPETTTTPRETIVQIDKRDRSGRGTTTRIIIPCTAQQFTEFAVDINNKTRTLGVNHWEGTGTLWNRKTYIPFREWLMDPLNEQPSASSMPFAIKDDRNMLVPTQELYNFLNAWLNTEHLPEEFEFGVENTTSETQEGQGSGNPVIDRLPSPTA